MSNTIRLYGAKYLDVWSFDEGQTTDDTHSLTISDTMLIPIPPKLPCSHSFNTYAFGTEGVVYRLCLNCGKKFAPPSGEWKELPLDATAAKTNELISKNDI